MTSKQSSTNTAAPKRRYSLYRKKVRVGTTRNHVEIVECGKAFFSLLEEQIDKAEHSIHFQIYVFDDDETGMAIAEALMRAAERNVEVYLLVDGFASQSLSKELIGQMKDSGIRFRFFEPLLKSRSFYFGRRLHHKVIVIDSVKAFVGSMNIADRYNDIGDKKAWLDAALFVRGEAALELYWICVRIWSKREKGKFKPPENAQQIIGNIPKDEHCHIVVRRNDWIYGKHQAYRTYNRMFYNAKKSITIVCSYFLPGRTMMNKLKLAVRRGVKVKIVLAGTSDVQTAKFAERYLYRWLIRNKIEIYEYQPTILHAKMAVADHQVFTLGSYNLNNLSAYSSVELNLEIDNVPLAEELEKQIDRIIENDCKKIDENSYNVPLISLRQFMQWAAFQFLRFILKITTFYYNRKE